MGLIINIPNLRNSAPFKIIKVILARFTNILFLLIEEYAKRLTRYKLT